MPAIRGRVVDVRELAAGGTEAVVLVEDRHELVLLPSGAEVPRRGDVVQVRTAPDQPAELRVLVRPEGPPWTLDGDATRWRQLGRDGSRLARLKFRGAALRAVREHLAREDFLELQTPLLVRGTCPDVHIDSVEVPGCGYLVTSTEYQVKRLFVGGVERAYTLTQNFRAGDVGAMHNPEFTMLEWARAGAGMDAIERDARELVLAAARGAGVDPGSFRYRGAEVDLASTEWERLTVREAFSRHLGVSVDARFSAASLRAAARAAGVDVPVASLDDARDLLTCLLDAVQPKLGLGRPTFLIEWPAFLTTSAPAAPGEQETAARSELFIAGVEVADGFPFLTDASRQREAFAAAQAERVRLGKPAVELDAAFLTAVVQGLPPGAGMALGFDRLMMLLTGSREIREVLAFAWDER